MNKEQVLNKYAHERQKCLLWARVMGYYRPAQSYNIGKKSEFKQRVYFVTQKENTK